RDDRGRRLAQVARVHGDRVVAAVGGAHLDHEQLTQAQRPLGGGAVGLGERARAGGDGGRDGGEVAPLRVHRLHHRGVDVALARTWLQGGEGGAQTAVQDLARPPHV